MIEKLQESIWFERKFAKIDDNKLIPGIIERLIGTPARVAQKIKNFPELQLEKHLPGKWSVKEEIGHLADLEKLWIGRILDFMEANEVLRSADLNNRKTHEAHHNNTKRIDLINNFSDLRTKLINAIELLESDDLEHVCLHPRLKRPMHVVDLLYFVAEHDDHHLARISRQIERNKGI